MRTIEHCITIWESVREHSMEAYKASVALKVMVEKLKALQSNQVAPQGPPGPKRAPNFGMFTNGAMADFGKVDDLAPEQSAAMTLGMLSSGGLSPGFGMGGTSGAQPVQSNEAKAQFPAGMAGLFNNPVQPEPTGMTPQYSGPEPAGMAAANSNGAASPFSQMFGQFGNGFTGMDGIGTDIDWVSHQKFFTCSR